LDVTSHPLRRLPTCWTVLDGVISVKTPGERVIRRPYQGEVGRNQGEVGRNQGEVDRDRWEVPEFRRGGGRGGLLGGPG